MKNHYREILRAKLDEMIKSNPNYSMRAFSKLLNIQPSQMSRVLSGKQNISPILARSIATRLYDQESDQNYFVSLVEYAVAKKPRDKEIALNQVTKLESKKAVENIPLETMRIISDWYHAAILELTNVSGVEMNAQRIGRFLGIPKLKAQFALERMEKLNLIKKRGTGYTASTESFSTPSNVPNEAIRSFHRQMIEKSLESIDEQSTSERFLHGKTIAINKRDYEQIQQMILKFNLEVADIVKRSSGRKNMLYQLNMQFFNLEHKRRKR